MRLARLAPFASVLALAACKESTTTQTGGPSPAAQSSSAAVATAASSTAAPVASASAADPAPSSATMPTPASDAPVPKGLVDGSAAFAVDLHPKLRAKQETFFWSPPSVSMAMSMLFGGARGKTAAEIDKAMHFGAGADKPMEAKLHEGIVSLVAGLGKGAGQEGEPIVRIANRLFGEKSFGFEAPYLAFTKERYGAELQAMDFTGAPGPSRDTINRWVEDRTEKKIKDLLLPSDVTKSTKLVLVNAIYFKGRWARPFDKAATKPEPFKVAAGKSVTVPTMHATVPARVGEVEGATVLQLRYARKQGPELALTIVLPTDDFGLQKLEGKLDAATLAKWLGAGTPQDAAVSLPRFTLTSRFLVEGALAELGVSTLFKPSADLHGIAKDPIFVSTVIHQAFVDVSEEGTEAAAATAIGVKGGGKPAEPRAVHVDHPFLFVLHDLGSKAVLFVGRVADPTAK